MTAEIPNFENGGMFCLPFSSKHNYFLVRERYSWIFVYVQQELECLGYHVGYESGYIGRQEDTGSVVMSIEVFVGKEVEEDLVEASFDITIEETAPGKGQLTYEPMTGPVDVPGINYRHQENGEEVTMVPRSSLVAKVVGEIHDMARIMIPAHKRAFD